MIDRKDVSAKLATVSPWVQEEIARLDDLLTALGATWSEESGPGRRYRCAGRTVMRVHPQQALIGMGFPLHLREDAEALTGAVRAQKDGTWVNHAPGLFDRDLIDWLVECACEQGRSRPDGARSADVISAGGARDDAADLAMLLAVLRAAREHEAATGSAGPVKVIREAIWFYWEAPRLPPGRKMSSHLPHSAAARARRDSGTCKGLIFEHVLPLNLVIRALLVDTPDDTQALRAVLAAHPERVIITVEEDGAIRAAGYQSKLPADGDPWGRYRMAGIDPQDFRPYLS